MSTTFSVTPVDAPSVSLDAPQAPAIKSLKARREALVAKLYLDLQVPRWDADGGPKIFVRYGPVAMAKLDQAVERRKKSDPKEWSLLASADALVDACIGVYVMEDGKQLSLKDGDPGGRWTRFDQDLANSLGLNTATSKAVDVVKYLYLTDGDLIAASNEVFEWSAVSIDKVDEDFTTP